MSHTYADLLEFVDQAQVVADAPGLISPVAAENSPPPNPNAQDLSGVIESDDDPHRLARVNLERYATRYDGRMLRLWRDEWYTWKRNAYRKITEKELRAKFSMSIREEFVRLNRLQQEIANSDDKGPAEVKKVSMHLVSNVLQATSGMVVVGADTEPNTWLPTHERKHYISMNNGILDVDAVLADRDDHMLPNSPQWFSMVSLPYAFNPDAKCPRWDAFLEHNLEMDPERIKILQEWAGYCLLPDTGEQKFMILEGEGANGKSVYTAALTAMLGEENVSTVPLEVFGDSFSKTSTLGKLLNAAGDCGELDKVAEGYLKSFTGGDRMFFNRKGVPGVDCLPTARLMVACNNRPRIGDRSDGPWRRMLLIPWRIQITREKRIKGMDKVAWWQDNGELPGIFRWALVGLARLKRQNGFTESTIMNEALAEYKEEMNPARSFLLHYMEPSTNGMVRAGTVYRFYKKWAEENGYRNLSERSFGKEVFRTFRNSKRIYRGTRDDRYWAYQGIQFSQAEICGEKTNEMQLV